MTISADVLKQYRVVDGQLFLGEQSATSLGERHGTPLYVYDASAIENRIKVLKATLPDSLSLHYAIKANPMPELVKKIAGWVDGLDVASAGELQLALDSGMPAPHISFAGPGKRDHELDQAIQAGVTLSVESPGELQRIAASGERVGRTPQVALRINPAFRLKASGMHMGGGPSPFGIDEELAPELLELATTLPVSMRGLHIYAGSQNLSGTHLIEAQKAIFDLAIRIAGHFPQGMEWLNIGGGFGIPYFPSDKALDIQPLADNLVECMQSFTEKVGDCEVVLELGRYLVGEAGVYLCRVIERKHSRGQIYLVTDGGMHHHLAASGNLGQVIRKNFPLVVADRITGGPQETVNVVGPLCTPLDMLGDRVALPEARPGDVIAVLQSGAYGYSASPLGFLSHPAPHQILV